MTRVQTVKKMVCCWECKESHTVFVKRTPIVVLCPEHALMEDLLCAVEDLDNVITIKDLDSIGQLSFSKLTGVLAKIRRL